MHLADLKPIETHVEIDIAVQDQAIVADDFNVGGLRGGDSRPEGGAFARVIYKGGYASARTSMELPISRRVVSAIEAARGQVVRMPVLGGSVPLYIFEQQLHTPMIGIPIANHDNNQHSANENIRLQNLWDGVETMAALMRMK